MTNHRLTSTAPRMAKTLQRAAFVLAELPNAHDPIVLALRRQIVDTILEATPEYYGEPNEAKYYEPPK